MGWPELETDAGLWLAGAWGCLALKGASGELASWPKAEPKAEPKAGPKAEPKAEPPCFRSQVVQEDSDEPEWVEAVLKVVLVDGWLQAHLYIYTSVAPP